MKGPDGGQARLDPKDIPADIYRLLENETDHEVSEKNVQWAGEVFMELLRTRLKKREDRRGEEVLRFSSLGKPDRQMWYSANMPEKAEKMPGKQLFKFLYGDCIEVLLLFLTKEAGHEVTHLQHSVEVDGVRGSMDAVIDGVPADCKSASPYGYKKFEDGSIAFDDAFGYIPQLSGYSHALATEHQQQSYTKRAGFLAAEKVAGDICWSEIDSYTIEGNPPGPKIAHQREVVNSPTPPARCHSDVPEGASGNRKLAIGCSYCAWKDECWKDANGGQGLRKFYYSRGPVWLSHVAREPKVNEA